MSVPILRARLYGAPVVPPVTVGPLRGQFVIHGNYPMGPKGERDSLALVPNNQFFFQELDQVWIRDQTLATSILKDAIKFGMSHIVAGPAYANGYAGDYPDTRYVGNPEPFWAYLEWLRSFGMRTTLFLFPDCGDYWLGESAGWDWDRIDQDLKPIYDTDRVRAAVHRVCFGWEIWSAIAQMTYGYDRMLAWFPKHPREWHTGPSHHSPGLSNENEEQCWRVAAAHGITGCMMQNAPPSQPPPERTPLDQLTYDLWDLIRRFRNYAGNPWGHGGPILSVDGIPLSCEYAEAVAYDIYRNDQPDSLGVEYADAALSVEHVVNTCDGIPTPDKTQSWYAPHRIGVGATIGNPRGMPGHHGDRIRNFF